MYSDRGQMSPPVCVLAIPELCWVPGPEQVQGNHFLPGLPDLTSGQEVSQRRSGVWGGILCRVDSIPAR